MTVTSSRKTQDMKQVVLHDEFGPLPPLAGEVVADLSWTYDEALERATLRWTDMTLYRILDRKSEYRYVVQKVGRSLLYHKVNSACNRGVASAVGLLKQDNDWYEALRVCPSCEPPDLEDLEDDDEVSVEQNLYTLYRCRDAMAVFSTLYSQQSSDQRPTLAQKLLIQATRVDPAIQEAAAQMRRM